MSPADHGRGALGMRSNYAGPAAPEDTPWYQAIGSKTRPGEGRIARGSRLSSEALEVIRDDRGLLSLALAAVVLDLLISGAFLEIASAVAGAHHRRLVLLGATAVASYPITVVGTFLNVALLNTVSRRWNGETVTIRHGLAVARRQWSSILAWSLIAASIGAVLSIAERVNHLAWFERLVAYALDIAWGAAAFFVIPALASDGVGPVEALRRSLRTVRRRWAEGATGTIAIGSATGLLLIPGVLLLVAGYHSFGNDPASGTLLLALGVLAAAPVLVYSSATSAVFTLAVYRYTEDENAHGPFTQEDLANPFVGGAKRLGASADGSAGLYAQNASLTGRRSPRHDEPHRVARCANAIGSSVARREALDRSPHAGGANRAEEKQATGRLAALTQQKLCSACRILAG